MPGNYWLPEVVLVANMSLLSYISVWCSWQNDRLAPAVIACVCQMFSSIVVSAFETMNCKLSSSSSVSPCDEHECCSRRKAYIETY